MSCGAGAQATYRRFRVKGQLSRICVERVPNGIPKDSGDAEGVNDLQEVACDVFLAEVLYGVLHVDLGYDRGPHCATSAVVNGTSCKVAVCLAVQLDAAVQSVADTTFNVKESWCNMQGCNNILQYSREHMHVLGIPSPSSTICSMSFGTELGPQPKLSA